MSEDYTPTATKPRGYKWMQPGERYGQVVTLKRLSTRKWRCICDCGLTFDTYGTHLRSGVTTSCGHWRASPDADSYNAVHLRLVKMFGRAASRRCTDCGDRAVDWSYNRSGVEETSSIRSGFTVVYSTDLRQYVPRCKRCHNHVDHVYGGSK